MDGGKQSSEQLYGDEDCRKMHKELDLIAATESRAWSRADRLGNEQKRARERLRLRRKRKKRSVSSRCCSNGRPFGLCIGRDHPADLGPCLLHTHSFAVTLEKMTSRG